MLWLSRIGKLRTRAISNSKFPGFSAVNGREQAYTPPFTVTVGSDPVQGVDVPGPTGPHAPTMPLPDGPGVWFSSMTWNLKPD
jgi:hypothetical protein